MTSDGIRPSRFGEKTLKRLINQVMIYLVAHDKVIEDSPVRRTMLGGSEVMANVLGLVAAMMRVG